MRILYLTGQFKYHGGIEKVLSVKMNYLADKLNQEVYLLTYEQGNQPFVYPISANVHYEDLDINYDVAIHHKGMFSPVNLKKGIKHIFRLRSKIKEIDPDVIILPNGGFDFMSLPFIASKKKIIREMHSSLYLRHKHSNVKENIRYYMDTFFEKKYSCIVTLNKTEEDFILNHHIETIPNPVFIPPYKEPALNSLMLVSAGRISPVKGYDKLIMAWKQVVVQYPSAVLHIYGSGEDEYVSSLKKKVEEEGLNHSIFFMGEVKLLTEVLPRYAAFISSSVTECFPMVFLEAMSCGLPVISFDCPTGPRHIISDGIDGFLADNQNIEALSQKIKLYLSNEKKNVWSAAAYEKAQNFSVDQIMKKWIRLFK